MKLSTKIILPIIIISALLILLAGCFGVPGDESPGTTTGTGTITGIIAAPCCDTLGEPVSENSGSPEYWCYWCEKDWFIQGGVEGVEVILTSGQDEIATTTTNDKGEYTFTGVPPGENFVITAYCPDDTEIPLVMDVVPKLTKGGSFNAGTTDLVSTSLGLVVDYVVYFEAWDPEDISLKKVIAAKPNFDGFPKFQKLIREVRRVLENCEDVDEDDELLDVLCRAAEEVSESDMGCAPGYTPVLEADPDPGPGPGPGPTPGPDPDLCDGNIAPVITAVTLDGYPIESPEHLVVGTSYTFCVYAEDDDIPSLELTYSLTVTNDGTTIIPMGTNSAGFVCFPLEPSFGDVGSYEITVNVSDGCEGGTDTWGPITIIVECNGTPDITSEPVLTVCLGEEYTYQVTATDPETDPLIYSLTTKPDGMSISSTGLITWTPTSDQIGENDVTVEVSDGCSSDTQEFVVNVIACSELDSIVITGGPIEVCYEGSVDITSEITVTAYYTGPGAPAPTDVTTSCVFSTTNAPEPKFHVSGDMLYGDALGTVTDGLTASYTEGTVTEEGTVDVTVKACSELDSIVITGGPIEVCYEGSVDITSEITVTAYYTGPGAPAPTDVTTSCVFSTTNAPEPKFHVSGDMLYGDALGTVTDGLTASYTEGTVTEEAQTGVNVIDCTPPCISADLSSFSLEIQEGSSWNEYLGSFSPSVITYSVIAQTNASHFKFTVTAECAEDATLFYNWYRGENCGDSWLTGESGYTDPPLTWVSISSGGTYPTPTTPRRDLVCTQGGNVLFIKVINAGNETIYKVYVDRSPQGQS